MAEELEFKISSGLKDIIGKDLITDDFIAVFELVKNSFDARAINVEIIFENDKIIIADNGKGMSYNDLLNKWLFVAYSAKKDNTEDSSDRSYIDKIQEKRYYAGAKGIGRFSSDRLGRYLSIKTKCLDAQSVENIIIDWNKFEIDQTDTFEKIKVKHDIIDAASVSFPKAENKGTILEISGLHNSWTRARILQLKYSLEKLINPFSSSKDFEIYIKCEKEKNEDNNGSYKSGKRKGERYAERDKVNGPVKNVILDILELKTSQLNFTIKDKSITTRIIDRGELIYHIKEEITDFDIIDDLQIDLFYLNRAAKYNFSLKMGIQPIQFGSIFLFKNGFRVQPFGKTGDDSWGIDFRAQQGYNRFLGTRDLFGRVDITTDNQEQFKEVSSRDGGLVETNGYFELMRAFEIAHRRLERYVVGVLWGEAFKRKHYFGTDDIALKKAEEYRESLSEDKDSSDLEIVKSNLGSKIDFIQIIKSLASDNNINIIDYNKAFVDLVNDNIDEHQARFISDLEKIAEITDDNELKNQILKTEERYQELKKEKEEAESKAKEEERKRIEAEQKAAEAERKRLLEKQRRKEEEERRRKAEIEAAKKETERALAELAKIKAEQKAKEEEEARKNAEVSLEQEKNINTYLNATRKTLSKDAEELVHSIKISVIGIDESLDSILLSLSADNNFDRELYSELSNIKIISERVLKISKLITKSNFKADEEVQKIDIVKYIKEYIDTYSYAYKRKVKISYSGNAKFISRISILDLSIVFDNLISNSQKANATSIKLEFINNGKSLEVLFHDNGRGVDLTKFPDASSLFILGMKSQVEGSGIGLYSVKKKMKEMYGDVEFVGNNISLKGATFKLAFK